MQTSHHSEPQTTHRSRLLEVKREFYVPVNQLFAAFSKADALKKWWWPRGLYSDHVDLNLNVGGKYFINMKGFDQGGGGMTGEFEEVETNKRMVMTDHFSDEKGNKISAGEAKMPGEWPEVLRITFEFDSLDEQRSSLKLYQEGIPDEVYKDCVQGWSESFDKLREYLEKS